MTTTNQQDGEQPPRNRGGRPMGSVAKITKEAREKAMQTGMLPHEFLLAIVQGRRITRKVPHPDPEKAADGITAEVEEQYTFEHRVDAAKSVANYYAPKISTVEVIQGVPDEQLDEFIARAAAEAGVSLGSLGEGAQDEAAGAVPPQRRRVD